MNISVLISVDCLIIDRLKRKRNENPDEKKLSEKSLSSELDSQKHKESAIRIQDARSKRELRS